jgi:hypothetical protein
MPPTANIRRLAHGKYIRAPLLQVVIEVTAVLPGETVVSVSPSVATPTTPTIGRAGNRTRSFISIQPS